VSIQPSKIRFNQRKEMKRSHWDKYHQTCKNFGKYRQRCE